MAAVLPVGLAEGLAQHAFFRSDSIRVRDRQENDDREEDHDRVRPGPVRTTLIRPRTSFVPEMLKSVENI